MTAKHWWNRVKRLGVREWVAYALSACFLWMAVAWAWGITGGNVSFTTKDVHHCDEIVSTDRYMREVWGVDGSQMLTKEPLANDLVPVFRLLPVARDGDGVFYVHVQMKADTHLFELYIAYDRVKWEPPAEGKGATISFVWHGEMAVILSRHDYSFWRFATFRQPATWVIDPLANRHVAADTYEETGMANSAVIALPADPSWQRLKEKNVG